MIHSASALAALLALGSVSAEKVSPLREKRSQLHKAHTVEDYITQRRGGQTLKEVHIAPEEVKDNLRGLREKNPDSRDNFLVVNFCAPDDYMCEHVESQFATLVNYCYDFNHHGVFLYKVNKKEVSNTSEYMHICPPMNSSNQVSLVTAHTGPIGLSQGQRLQGYPNKGD